jgi:hypothetical protein
MDFVLQPNKSTGVPRLVPGILFKGLRPPESTPYLRDLKEHFQCIPPVQGNVIKFSHLHEMDLFHMRASKTKYRHLSSVIPNTSGSFLHI